GIYRIDPEVSEAIWNTSIEGQLPAELLFHLPEWCVYIETPGKSLSTGKCLEGFFAHLNAASAANDPELHLLLDDPAGVLHSIAIPLSVSTLEEACRIASIGRTDYEHKICWSNGNVSKIGEERMAAAAPADAAANLSPLIQPCYIYVVRAPIFEMRRGLGMLPAGRLRFRRAGDFAFFRPATRPYGKWVIG
ncbi:MAG: hypothetical protein JOZ29_21735, partial [Deltaproteobacteria bacterium]|nr:hypothetical protein [Deltaproteobacteria bacterium]